MLFPALEAPLSRMTRPLRGRGAFRRLADVRDIEGYAARDLGLVRELPVYVHAFLDDRVDAIGVALGEPEAEPLGGKGRGEKSLERGEREEG